MRILKKYSPKLLWLLPVMALAAVPFIPDLVNSTTLATQPVGYVGAPVASGYVLTSANNQSVFMIDYSSLDWSGDLHSYALSANGAIGTTDLWANQSTLSAAQTIEAQNTSGTSWNATGRNIVTMGSTGAGVPFLWGNLTTAQKTALDSTQTSTAPYKVLNYIRGDHTNEASKGGAYRTRNKVLGDIIHSTPRFWDDGTIQTVFVGANDGMLHAINALSGAEIFAYIPSSFILQNSVSKLAALINTNYAHQYFVDGQMAAHKFGTQSILAGGLGGGGMGLYALDITSSPASETEAAGKVLWEITNTSVNNVASSVYANLGHTYGTPVMAKLNSGVNALLVANGYNNTGNGHSSLFIINPATGALIKEIDAGTGTLSAPNGLSSPTVVDTDSDGDMDYAYAGDINGNLWKFDLTTYKANATDSTFQATKLFTVGSSPDNTTTAQAITMAPGIKAHPYGGYMVNFVTGRIFESVDTAKNNDEKDTMVHSAYGIWDRPAAYAANNVLFQQQLTETCFPTTNPVTSPCVQPSIRVRTAQVKTTSPAQATQPNWSAGTANHMGWKTQLAAGERVVGDGAFVTGSVFLFLSTNPTVNATLTPPSENWWMQLNAMTGGDNDGAVRFDLSADTKFTDADKVTVAKIPATSPATNLTLSPVGRFMGGGVRSQLTAFTTSGFDLYLANYDKNGDPPLVTTNTDTGVAGGHFDEDIYYGVSTKNTQAKATITVTAASQTSPFPATLGAITVNGIVVVPALTITDIPDGTAVTSNANKLISKMTNGFSATRSNGVITITAPSGTGSEYNGTINIDSGSSQKLVYPVSAVAAVAPTSEVLAAVPTTNGSLVFTGVTKKQSVSVTCGSKTIFTTYTSTNTNTQSILLNELYNQITNAPANNYSFTCSPFPTTGSTSKVTCSIHDNTKEVSQCPNGFQVTNAVTSTNTGPVGGSDYKAATSGSAAVPAVAQSGWTDFKPALSSTAFSGGVTANVAPFACNSATCNSINNGDVDYMKHVHEYDDIYDRTGVNMLNASDTRFNLANAIPSTATQFKVIASNQYLSPAVSIHFNGTPAYVYNVNAGYISMKNFLTSATLDVTDETQVPTYTRANVNSLTINMPVEAFTPKDWWGGAMGLPEDVRVGLHPVGDYACVVVSESLKDGLMYRPIIPPSTVTTSGNGTLGWSSSTVTTSTGASKATGVRHNGALTIQVIKANTPQADLELSVPNHSEYGWRVKSDKYTTDVLAEYTTFWHTKTYSSTGASQSGPCYGATNWTKLGYTDTRTCGSQDTATTRKCATLNKTAADAAKDPKIGAFGVGSPPVAGTTTTTVTNADGTTTTTVVNVAINANGTATTTTTVTNSNGGSTTTVTGNDIDIGGVVDSSGVIGGGVTTPLEALGRVSWRELFK